MKNWDELKTAYKVASLRKISLAADALKVHRSTVIRQVDALEERLGVRLFVRGPSGYTPTLEGEELLRVVEAAERQFVDLEQHLSKPPVQRQSTLTITSICELSPSLFPVIQRFCFAHPEIKLNFQATEELVQLEFGEADIAIRPGLRPTTSRYKTEIIRPIKFGLYGKNELKEKHRVNGRFETAEKLPFVKRYGIDKTDFEAWMTRTIPNQNIIYEASCVYTLHDMISNGQAVGFMPTEIAKERPHISEIPVLGEDWRLPLYVAVTHDKAKDANCALFLDHLRSSTY
ncbi:MAG: LysR family transcriptional regulator [Pseudomonadota bacterium]